MSLPYSADALQTKNVMTALRQDQPLAVSGAPAYLVGLFLAFSLVLRVDGIDLYPQFHAVLDTVLCLLSGVLAFVLGDMGKRLDNSFKTQAARTFALTFCLMLLHVLVAVEWSGLLDGTVLLSDAWRLATWAPSVHLLPLGLFSSLWLLRRDQQETRVFTPVLLLLAGGLLSLFFLLPRYTAPSWLGITRPTLLLVPVAWAVVAVASWRLRVRNRLLPLLTFFGIVQGVANLPMLYATSPHDGPTVTSHLLMTGGFLALLLSVMQMASQDMRERVRAEQELARANSRLEMRVRERTAQVEEATAALRKSEARLQFLLSASPAILYSARASKDFSVTYMGPNVERFFGYPPEAFFTTEFWKQHVHPDDLPKTEVELSQLLEKGKATFEYRFLTASGHYRWVQDTARLIHHSDGATDEIVGYWVDIHEQKSAERALRQSEVQYQALFRKMPIPTYMWRRQGEDYVLVGYNDAAEQITDHRIAALLGVRLHELYKAEPQMLQDFLTCIGQEGVVRREMHYALKSSGAQKSLSVHYAFVPPDTVMVHTEDITERTQAEEEIQIALAEKETLLREIHHRVKNNLQIVSSLLYFQSKQASPENAQVFLEAQSRVRSMTLVHEQLYQAKNLSRIDFAPYARALAQQVTQSYGHLSKKIRLSIEESESIELPIETALPCGMMLNELLTNVYKYAFPNGQGGTAVVKIERVEDRMQLQVSDDGVGLPDSVNVTKPASFGLRLIQNLAAQVRGTIQYKQGKGTTAILTLTIPERTTALS
jgi:PAS domain S-box-containing protein